VRFGHVQAEEARISPSRNSTASLLGKPRQQQGKSATKWNRRPRCWLLIGWRPNQVCSGLKQTLLPISAPQPHIQRTKTLSTQRKQGKRSLPIFYSQHPTKYSIASRQLITLAREFFRNSLFVCNSRMTGMEFVAVSVCDSKQALRLLSSSFLMQRSLRSKLQQLSRDSGPLPRTLLDCRTVLSLCRA